MIKIILLLALLMSACADQVYADIRCCVEPERYSDGRIIRSLSVIEDFKKIYPLPENFNRDDYQINHAIPLVCGGRDIVENLIWMHVKAKTCADDYCQDRHEQLTMCPRSYHK